MLKKLIFAALVAAALFFYPQAAALTRTSAPDDVGRYLLLEKASQVIKLTPTGNFRTGGTGFHVRAPSGKVYGITNRHVCELSSNGRMASWIPGTERHISVAILYMSDSTDLCLIEAQPGATGLTLSEEQHLKDKLYSLGHPLLNALTLSEGYAVGRTTFLMPTDIQIEAECKAAGHEWREMNGFLGPIEMCMDPTEAIDTSIPTYPGNSGSPVFYKDGTVVGVIFAGDMRTNRGGYVPLDVVHDFLNVY